VRFVRASQLRAHLFFLSAEGIGKKYGNCSVLYMVGHQRSFEISGNAYSSALRGNPCLHQDKRLSLLQCCPVEM